MDSTASSSGGGSSKRIDVTERTTAMLTESSSSDEEEFKRLYDIYVSEVRTTLHACDLGLFPSSQGKV